MSLQKFEQNRVHKLLQEPNKIGIADAALIEKLLTISPYFSAAHLLNSTIKKDLKIASLASIYSNGKTSKKFYEISLNNIAEEEELVFEEIEELDTTLFSNQGIEIETLRRGNLQNDIIASLDVDQVQQLDTYKNEHIETVVPDTESLLHNEDKQRISKYDDDQLPYTFLWWLAKTRATHKAIFQPYAAPKVVSHEEEPNPLQQQYVEHIFHLQTGVGINENLDNAVSENYAGKNSDVIEAFLEKDPQIKPPQHNKLDNENKARKSAEDQNDVVSETLANIYIEQMLYRKAIETYEKLVLKFPEKSRYFADLIRSLEKKL